MIGYLMATNRGEHWKLSKAECDLLGERTAKMVSYLPVPAGNAGLIADFSLFGLAAVGTFGKRVQIDLQIKAAREAAEREGTVNAAQRIINSRPAAMAPDPSQSVTGTNGATPPQSPLGSDYRINVQPDDAT